MIITTINDLATIPTYAHADDSGMDLCSTEEIVINPGNRALIGTGLTIELDPLTEAQVRPRSGLAYNRGITVLNSPGTIDEGYRGEIKVLLINLSHEWFKVTVGMKIAQLVIAPIIKPDVLVARQTERGDNGFGSTGLI